jgi:hypothetical protein
VPAIHAAFIATAQDRQRSGHDAAPARRRGILAGAADRSISVIAGASR